MVQKGGKVIASGGFGCIFKPSLKCVNTEQNPDNISKLMTVKHSTDEYNQIQALRDILQNIPNYHKYFLVDGFTLCEPDKLTKDDLVKFDDKCKTLKKDKITSKNINKKLDNLLAINMPYGGIDIIKYMSLYRNGNQIIILNNSLINLLVYGVLPMNKLNCFHGDIKDGNILVNTEDNSIGTRLIDWGISFQYTYIKDEIPDELYRRPFQFNVPFSVIIFNKEFTTRYKDFLNVNPEPLFFQIREFVINYIFIWRDIRGDGHFEAINTIMNKLFVNDLPAIKIKNQNKIITYDVTYYYIIEYISKVLEKYTINNTFMMDEYFNNIFLKILDVWGFVMVYISLYEEFYDNYDNLNEYQMQFMEKIKYIIIHFLYENPTTEINIQELIDELKKLNTICINFETDIPSLKNTYLQDLKSKSKQNKTKKGKTNKGKTNKGKTKKGKTTPTNKIQSKKLSIKTSKK